MKQKKAKEATKRGNVRAKILLLVKCTERLINVYKKDFYLANILVG
jgi:hypothetical protein